MPTKSLSAVLLIEIRQGHYRVVRVGEGWMTLAARPAAAPASLGALGLSYTTVNYHYVAALALRPTL